MTLPAPIRVAALVIRDDAGRVLCVRKVGSPRFQLPGGKPEGGESAAAAAVRETEEEVRLTLTPDELGYLGVFTAEASNEPGFQVTATVFIRRQSGTNAYVDPVASAEIDEVAWIDPLDPGSRPLAPLLEHEVFPALREREISAIAVFAGANTGSNPANLRLADDLGAALARRGITLVYGGSRLGVMGRVAEATTSAGGRAVGVLTNHLANHELRYEGLYQLEMVETMAQRKQRMAELSCATIALPGGTGTLDELFDQWTTQQLGYHSAPIGLLGVEFWAPFVAMIDHMVAQGFIRPADRASLVLSDDADALIDGLRSWVPPIPRWM
ncbi:TIGR00730 family Rossman fold protein [Corynebacterium liangguodongii]|uniref:TIGR00730 family Rossman fold protein n=1 Tax=Corynebacterium liangguodongii TaxID=2079535 RepID=A0A2S0WGI2_9CORY|nr:TIGR00730 family Rossman fold protein [Corynebacterium liangguodongii]AWB84879.1 TIGR00730 family Rossman fold protein [Corynebacterium liangguodongii]PWB99235.1 TIGR00730 family Rossman fold protein [Corynebacterium liangguodongii]